MIPIPSLLCFEECSPQNNDDVVKEENTDTDRDDQDSMKEIQYRRRRRQQQHSPSTTNRLSQPSVPLRLRRIIEIEPQRRQRYDYDQFSNPRTRFWELQQHEERQQQSQHNNNNNNQGKLVVSIHRKSQLCIFLFTLIPFILVDEWSLLPAGTIFYITALSIAWENWMNELEQDQLFIQQLKYQRQKRNKLHHEIENAKFEYHILKNEPYVDIKVIINERGNNDKNDKNSKNNNFDPKWTIYADERRH